MECGDVSGYVRNSKLAAYQSVSVHGGVANSDPHGLVLMLMDAAVERMTTARGCMERGDIVRKAKLLHSCISLIAELRGCLDMARGGAIAQNLSDLYDYMMRQLLRANVDNNPAFISEVLSLLAEIRSAWVAIGPEVRQMARVVPPSA
ncbi:MAG: flagellar export chaperone FliS [Steroidobacteraceae bacterium]|jgi:flagellar secretion chaperone FliS